MHTRRLDAYRPITLVLAVPYNQDLAMQYFDVVCINRYYAWYDDPGQLDLIKRQLVNDVTFWWEKYHMPVMVTEYGADTMVGLHQVCQILTYFLNGC